MARARQRKLHQRRRNAQELIIIPLVLIVAMAVLIVSTPRFSGYAVAGNFGYQAQLHQFVQCLAANGASFYGSYDDPQTRAQKNALGGDVASIYVECNSEHIAYDAVACQGINVVPLWKYRGQERLGFQTLLQLSQLTGCR